MSKSTKVTPFTWGDIELTQTVMIDGIPHVTRRAIGEWLEYDDPVRSVSKLIERNQHVDHYSVVVNLTTTDNKKYDTNAYHPIGFLLIVMESGQPRAQSMKVAVGEFVWNFAGPKGLDDRTWLAWFDRRMKIMEKMERSNNPFILKAMGEDLNYISQRLNLPVPAFVLLGKDESQLSLEGM